MITRLQSQIDFISTLERLKTVHRQNATLDGGRPENPAEHSWHLAVMAMLLAEHAELSADETIRAVKMLLIHDLPEIDAGDTFLYDNASRDSAPLREEQALLRLTSVLPEDQRQMFRDLWLEMEEGRTPAARFARTLDALQPLLNHLITAPENYNPWELTAEQVTGKKEFIRTDCPALWPLAEKLIEQSREKGLYR